MKISELRTILKKKDEKLLNDAFVEVYKLLPKDKKEEADSMIESILSGKGKVEKKAETINIETLVKEIHVFIQHAYDGLYLKPNRIVSKSERPKWRIKVKNYIKVLSDVTPEDKHYAKAVLYLEEIYKMLTYGCAYYIFSTEDPFHSVGVSQEELLGLIVERKKVLGIDEKEVKKMIYMACVSFLSRESLHEYLIGVLLSIFNRENYGYIFIQVGKKLIESYQDELKKLSQYSQQRITLERDINEINNLVFAFSNEMNCEDMKYYFEYSYERDEEVSLYVLLGLIDRFGSEEKWVEAYEYGVKDRNIHPRDYLVTKYQNRLEEKQIVVFFFSYF